MEKRADNTFVGGVVTDRHPLAAQNTELIEARNIDLIQVGDGYQLVLQKRVGNEKVLYDDGLGGGAVSAGLPAGYIPLAVKEFNNIAYIISVNPNTGFGQIGTFPSPDYSALEYVSGPPIPAGASTTAGTYVEDADTPEYSYTVTPVANAGTDEEVDGNALGRQFINAGFTITNTGLNIESYDFSLDLGTNLQIYANNVLFTPGVTAPYTLAPGGTVVVTVRIVDAYIVTPGVVATRIITITPQDDPTPVVSTHTFRYHTTVAMQVKSLGDWDRTSPVQDTISFLSNVIDYDARSNDPGMTFAIALISETAPGGWSSITPLTMQLTVTENTSGAQRTSMCRITGTYSGGTKQMDTVLTQEIP